MHFLNWKVSTILGDLFTVDINGQVNQSVRISPFVVIPGDNFVEVVIEVDACPSINNRASRVMNEILGYNLVLSVSQDTLKVTLCSLLQSSLNFISSAGLFGTDSQIDKRDIWGWNTNSHSSELAIELRDDFSNCFGSSCTCWNAIV